MAKANKWFRAGNTTHRKMGLYKIPIEDRKKFMVMKLNIRSIIIRIKMYCLKEIKRIKI